MKKSLLVVALVVVCPPAFAHPDHSEPFPGGQDFASPRPIIDGPYGRVGDSTMASRSISVAMADTGRCSPASLAVRQGETVKLLARNSGKQPMEFAIGTASDLRQHAEMLQKFPQMRAPAAHRVHAQPGQTAELVWHFTRTGEFNFACAAPGQFAATNLGKLVVTP